MSLLCMKIIATRSAAMPRGFSSRLHRALFILVAASCFCLPSASNAQTSGSYITPFPSAETYRLHVYGDSLANGLYSGLTAELDDAPDIRVEDRARSGTGLTRTGSYDWPRAIQEAAISTEVNIAVLMFGASDRQSLRANGRRHQVGSETWNRIYAERVDAILDTLRDENAAIYWVGLPIMKGANRNTDMQRMNAIFRERALRRGLRYIDTWDGFADQDGNYTDWGPDLDGRVQRLRARDGVHFSERGYRKLANFVARVIKRDLTVAKSQRAVPLAGGDEELNEIRQRLQRSAQTAALRSALPEDSDSSDDARPTFTPADAPSESFPANNSTVSMTQKGQDGRTQALKIELARPAIPAAVVSHIRRRSPTAARRTSGDALPISLGDGLTVVGRMTPSSTWVAENERRGAVSPTQTPYYKVLVKGESLPPKPGRADDFAWPRPGMPVDPAG